MRSLASPESGTRRTDRGPGRRPVEGHPVDVGDRRPGSPGVARGELGVTGPGRPYRLLGDHDTESEYSYLEMETSE
jgi:hypothetical protein